MAQTARLGALADELIQSVIDFDPATNMQAYRHAKEIATRELRGQKYARTNQFDIAASFAGLDEKFRIKNRDDLADALQQRLQELQGLTHKFKPEFLSLLLLLANRPLENTKIEALDLLRPPTPPPPLTWQQILIDDPYSDDELWKDIDYAGDTSDEEQVSNKKGNPKPSLPTSVEDNTYNPETSIIPTNLGIVKEIQDAQFWRTESDLDSGKVEISELHAVRETLFMLAGLQTSLYETDSQYDNIRVNLSYTVSHTIPQTASHLLAQFALTGRDIYRLRKWTRRPSSLPLIQTFEAAVAKRLTEYDSSLAQLQQRYLVPDSPISVSLLELEELVRSTSNPLLRLARMVSNIEPKLLVNPFAHLESLFDQITLAQVTLEQDVFEAFSKVFFECLQTYLKPIRTWMVSGELGANDETFFVFENDSSSEASSLWHDRFVLRRDSENQLRSPRFLEPAARKIFNTGKSVVFLKELGIYSTILNASQKEPRLDHEIVCGVSKELPPQPFPELFDASFQSWIRSKYSLASHVLREHLFEQCGLIRILIVFRTLYFGANGSVFQDFADAIFECMDENRRGWNDRFLLTELARAIFGIAVGQSAGEKIAVRSIRSKTEGPSVKELRSVSIDYALPWSIQNIIQRSSTPIYQQILTFLLQLYRAKYLLQRVTLADISSKQNRSLNQMGYRLRQRLIWFVDTTRHYLTEIVLNQATQQLDVALTKAEDIDEMSDIHIRYIAKVQEQSLLSKDLKIIHQAVIELLDLSVTFSELHRREDITPKRNGKDSSTQERMNKASNASRRKSFVPTLEENELSGEEDEVEGENEDIKTEEKTGKRSMEEALLYIDKEFARLLAFVIAGLRSVGRVGAEPLWEMLADMLEWKKRDRV